MAAIYLDDFCGGNYGASTGFYTTPRSPSGWKTTCPGESCRKFQSSKCSNADDTVAEIEFCFLMHAPFSEMRNFTSRFHYNSWFTKITRIFYMTKINELDKKERYYTAEFKSNFIQNHEAMQNLQNVPPMSFLTKIRLKHSCSQKIQLKIELIPF